ncbi:MAG: hypothetical protein ACE5JH_09290 [Acidobacteriota bacterium]
MTIPMPTPVRAAVACALLGPALVVLPTIAAAQSAPRPVPDPGAAPVSRPPPAPPSEEEIRRVEQRGREIAFSLDAVGRARVEFDRYGEPTAAPDHLLLLRGRDVWRVVFVKEAAVDKGRPRTWVVAEISFVNDPTNAGPLRIMSPPRPAADTTVTHLRAMEIARSTAVGRGLRPPLDAAIFRERNGTFSAYLKSRPQEAEGVLFGADLLIRVAATGRRLISGAPLHAGVPVTLDPGDRPPGGPTVHSHLEADLPTATDVATVMRHARVAPHLVLTPHFIFRIDAAGRVSYLGPNPDPPAPPAVPRAAGGKP